MKKIIVAPILIFVGFFQIIAQNQLLIPEPINSTVINLKLQNDSYQFYDGINTATMGVNGNILGPTLIMNKGDLVDIKVDNQIGETTTIHWHGMHVSPENDGGPHTTIAPNTVWNPKFTVMDKAGTYWYHPHLHEKTNEHVSKGIAGMIIVRDDEEAALILPRTYGVDDFPMVLQTKDFDANRQIVVPSNSDDVIMVNATINAVLIVPAQVIRFRLLNGSSMRVFNIGLDANKNFYQIASDGGLLTEPLNLTRLRLAPGERAEILVDFSGMQGKKVNLMSYASEFPDGIYGATNPGMGPGMVLDGYIPNPLNGTDFNIMQFDIVAKNTSPVTTIPSKLVTVTKIPESDANLTRVLTMTAAAMGPNQLNGDFLINNVSFDLNVINYEIPINNTEVWSIRNQSAIAHPFHIHDVQFFVLDRNGVAPPATEQGRKDVILVEPQETVRFITKFEDFSSPTVPYMYHCHMLYHEDRGMMGQFLVLDKTASVQNEILNQKIAIYPNPVSEGMFTLKYEHDILIDKIEVFDVQGKLMTLTDDQINGNTFQLKSFSKGIYFLKISTDSGAVVKKIIKE
ncbi:MAG: bilirubin oxidase [Bacteroidetes bacterium]|nr:MAG: bilirubin oxidase [Bacteroidota bacterium]